MITLWEFVIDQFWAGVMAVTFSANTFTLVNSTRIHFFTQLLTLHRFNLDITWFLRLVSTPWEGCSDWYFANNIRYLFKTLFLAFVAAWKIHDFHSSALKIRNFLRTSSFHIMTTIWELVINKFWTIGVHMPWKTWLPARMFVAVGVRITT
jgi:hypothetical protein